ncbi:MAG: ABC transporter ATP-binding protein [Lachnospiraceae bacterium]|nr:ABC transporter ATP-binding protein [Lachnospiraceae bacterium]
MSILQTDNLTFSYPDAERPALRGVSLSLEEGSFSIIYGPSGCGKSTLLKLLKKEIAPYGKLAGERKYAGISYEEIDARTAASEIGYLSQDPDSQIVADVVWQELAFALENLGTKPGKIRARVAEMAAYFGIEGWFHKKTSELSGGQKQLLNLASVMTLEPKVLLLDEPTAQLDPIAAGDFYAMIVRLHRELGVTVLIAEHRLEEILSEADRVLILTDGELRYSGKADEIGTFFAKEEYKAMAAGLPAAVRLYTALQKYVGGESYKTPLSVTEGRAFIRANFGNEIRSLLEVRKASEEADGIKHAANTEQADAKAFDRAKQAVAVSVKDARFRYGKHSDDILRDTSLTVFEGEHYCLLGGNGSGKTTLLSVILGTNRVYAGSVNLFGKSVKSYRDGERNRGLVAMLPQNPKDVFVCDVVREDWVLACKTMGLKGDDCDRAIEAMAEKLGTKELLNRHPYDLSGGEQQKAALGKVLLLNPRLLLLDEPTKGLDAAYKKELKSILKALQAEGTTLLTVTHDTEWAAELADRVGLFFDGDVSLSGPVREVFSQNAFYTTPACRIARGCYDDVMTCEEIAELCAANRRGRADATGREGGAS